MPKPKTETKNEVTIKLPIRGPIPKLDPHNYKTRHLDVQSLTEAQRWVARHLYDSLVRQGAKLESGQPVKNPPDVVRYLLDRIAVSAGFEE